VSTAEPAARLTLGRLLIYAAPALPLAMLGIPLLVFLPNFWSGPMGMSLGTFGAVVGFVRVFDVVVDPTIGRLSDLSRSRFGRRKPFIAAAIPIALIGAIGLFFPPAHAGWLWLLVFYALVTWGWTILSLPYYAWGSELSDNYRERQRITSFRDGGGTLIGIILSLTLPVILGITNVVGESHLLVYMTIALAGPLVLAALIWVPDRLPRRPKPPVALMAALRVAAGNKPFRSLISVWLINGLANGLPASLFIMVCTQFLHDEKAQGPLLMVYFLAGVFSVPLWLWLAGKIGKHRAWIVSLLFTAFAFAFVPLVPHVGLWFFGLISLFTGSGLDFTIPPSIQADVIDLDELRSGEQRAGLFFSASTMAQKAGQAASVIAFPLLQLAGFSTNGHNSGYAIAALVFMYCGVPSLLKLVCAFMLKGFPLDEAAQSELRREIELAAA
jgi:GPH family glycoside/pentoside/hexuronide:cation symporter